jgi:hypothetical protein
MSDAVVQSTVKGVDGDGLRLPLALLVLVCGA